MASEETAAFGIRLDPPLINKRVACGHTVRSVYSRWVFSSLIRGEKTLENRSHFTQTTLVRSFKKPTHS